MEQQQQVTLEDAARAAVAAGDGPRVCRIADQLRFKRGLNYEGTIAFFERVGGTRDEIEGYFYEGDANAEGGE